MSLYFAVACLARSKSATVLFISAKLTDAAAAWAVIIWLEGDCSLSVVCCAIAATVTKKTTIAAALIVFIAYSRLRRKIGPTFIETVRNLGYRMKDPA